MEEPMYRSIWISAAAGVLSASFTLACDRDREVREESQDLTEARKNTGVVANELEQELREAKAEVVRLEKQLAMAREGVTEEVLTERRELQSALEEQGQNVEKEIEEAKREAQQHNQEAEQARQQLEQTQVPSVEAEVQTQTQVVKKRTPVGATQEQETIEVQRVRGVDRERPAQRASAVDAGAAPREPSTR
jgi:hypothetical protein